MIGIISGQVQHLNAPVACIMTASGVGYEVEMPLPAFCQLNVGESVSLYTHFHVREDAQMLFGFLDQQDKEIFRKLIKINGVGTKMALAILSTLSCSQLKRAVDMDDDVALVKVPGVGRKTAQRLIIELKGKLNELTGADPWQAQTEIFDVPSEPSSQMRIIAEVEGALINLGYKEKDAQNAIKKVQAEQATSAQSLLKAALKQLSGF